MHDSIIDTMRAAPIWLLWKAIVEPGKSKPRKVPYYLNGAVRSGVLDSPDDRAQLGTYEQAAAAYGNSGGAYAGLAIALGPDGRGGHWQGIDLDDMVAKGVTDIADMWTRGPCAGLGYVEVSPSGNGIHLIGYGRQFQSLGSNSSGIEAYAGGRFFTFTERPIVADSPCRTYDLADYVEQALAQRHGAARSESAGISEAGTVQIPDKTVTELRSALTYLRADERDLWIAVGHALKELGEVGRELWLTWSRSSSEHDPVKDPKKWDGFRPRNTSYQAVFKKAQDAGWTNPASNAAQPDPVTIDLSAPPAITLEFAMSSDTATVTLEYLLDPFLPAKCVVGGYGRGSTAKSSLYASAAAHISPTASTLWVSVEEPADWIKTRHITCGGREHTLAVVKAVASKKDAQGRVIASSFNVYEHLEPAIANASAGFAKAGKPPLRLVVLDTAVGLTGWGKGETPNDDASVKKLLGFLQALAERYNLTIVAIGHANKGKHEHFADTVMGASAWTNSPRLSFVHAADVREDYSYVMRVAKTNFDTFGVPYKTQPVHTLYERTNGPDTVLVRAVPGDIVWGEAASMEMFMEATKKLREDEDGGGGGGCRGQALDAGALQVLVEMVLELPPGECITREDVEREHGRPVNRRRWAKIDEHLNLHPLLTVERGDKNRVLYRRRPVAQ